MALKAPFPFYVLFLPDEYILLKQSWLRLLYFCLMNIFIGTP